MTLTAGDRSATIARMMQGPNRAPLILGVTVVLAFGAGLVAQSVTGDTSGEAMIMTVLPIIGIGIVAMVLWQGGWMKRSRAAGVPSVR